MPITQESAREALNQAKENHLKALAIISNFTIEASDSGLISFMKVIVETHKTIENSGSYKNREQSEFLKEQGDTETIKTFEEAEKLFNNELEALFNRAPEQFKVFFNELSSALRQAETIEVLEAINQRVESMFTALETEMEKFSSDDDSDDEDPNPRASTIDFFKAKETVAEFNKLYNDQRILIVKRTAPQIIDEAILKLQAALSSLTDEVEADEKAIVQAVNAVIAATNCEAAFDEDKMDLYVKALGQTSLLSVAYESLASNLNRAIHSYITSVSFALREIMNNSLEQLRSSGEKSLKIATTKKTDGFLDEVLSNCKKLLMSVDEEETEQLSMELVAEMFHIEELIEEYNQLSSHFRQLRDQDFSGLLVEQGIFSPSNSKVASDVEVQQAAKLD
jgi:predicted RNA-binding Zn ribbon-like protein